MDETGNFSGEGEDKQGRFTVKGTREGSEVKKDFQIENRLILVVLRNTYKMEFRI